MRKLLVLLFLMLWYPAISQNIPQVKDGRDTASVGKDDGGIPLPHIYVYGSRADFGVRSTQMSAVALPRLQVKVMPKLFGETDIFKVLQKLPGVQSSGDGTAGIYVRGGDYDQNLITLDGSTLYNAEHLKGFVSAVNADMVDNVVLYKGGFPARYGARLSSIVDIGIKEGDFEKYHGSIGIGMLSSRVNVEGPLIKGTTSFNIGVRASYFDAILMPLLEDIYDDADGLKAFADMDYYDINAKIVHRFSSKDKLSAVFYMGRDVNDSAPTDSKMNYSSPESIIDNSRSNKTENEWGNIVSSIFYTHRPDDKLSLNTNLSFSRYDYRLKMYSEISEKCFSKDQNLISNEYIENSNVEYNSDINDLALSTDLNLRKDRHNLRLGAKISMQKFGPITDVFKDTYRRRWTGLKYEETFLLIDTVMGGNHNMHTLALYAEDDFKFNGKLNVNLGLRYSMYSVKGKAYHSLEPRAALRYLVNGKMSLKASYSRMAQGVHLLSSSNLVMPSDIWVPVTREIPLMTSDQWAVGVNYEPTGGFGVSVEGYYKTMNNVMEYAEGASYTRNNGDWQNQIVLGRGKACGVEFLIEKKTGKTTGWIGYTLAKSLRQFDSDKGIINGGKEFYAGNDRRHNFNLVFAHQFNKHWRISANWTFQSGRRGTISTKGIYGGKPEEYDPFSFIFSGDSYTQGETIYSSPDKALHFYKFLRYYTPNQRNGYVLPDVHRLDLSVNYTAFVGIGDMDVSLDVYNVYNRMNISNVYLGYHNDQMVLKGVCMFPFMPSLSIALTF